MPTKTELLELSRDDLDARAKRRGIHNPEEYATKQELAEALLGTYADATTTTDDGAAAAVDSDAPYGWEVVGDDGRRIVRGYSESAAREFANRLTAETGEELTVQPGEASAPSVADVAPPAGETGEVVTG